MSPSVQKDKTPARAPTTNTVFFNSFCVEQIPDAAWK